LDRDALNRSIFIFLISATAIAVQISLARIFSVIFWYHFSFLILSVSLTGLAVGGILVKKYSDVLAKKEPDAMLCTGGLLCGLLLTIVLFFITNNPFHATNLTDSPKTIILFSIVEFLTTSFALFLFFTLIGSILVFVFQTWRDNLNKYYAVNLAGSATGCLLAICLLNLAGAVNAIILLAAILATSAVFISAGRYKKLSNPAIFVILSLICSLPFSGNLFPLKALPGKPVLSMQGQEFIYKDWDSLSKLDIFKHNKENDDFFGLWGLPDNNKAIIPERLGLLTDYLSYSTILKHDTSPGYYDFLKTLPMYTVYDIAPKEPDTLIIGPGGGMDIRAALETNSKSIDTVEINASIVRAMKTEFAEYSGNLYNKKPVNLITGDGRQFVETTDRTYDLIQLSGVETYCATQSGAFTLTENYIYTREAFATFFNHLRPEGVLTISRWYSPSTDNYPRFTMRLFALVFETLKSNNCIDPSKNIMLFQSNNFAVLLAKKTAFTQKEIALLATRADQNNYTFLYRPDTTLFTAIKFYSYIMAENKDAWADKYPFNISPPTDNKPFYFETRKLKSLFSGKKYNSGYSMYDGQTVLVMLTFILILALFILAVTSWKSRQNGNNLKSWFYFFATGMGFMLAEVTFTQQLILPLGHPVYALSVVMFSFLFFAGAGSLSSIRLSRTVSVRLCLFIITALLITEALTLPLIVQKLTGAESLTIRIFSTILFLAPPSFLMGIAFPCGIRRFSPQQQDRETGTYWAWSCIGSVIGSVIAVLLAIEFGFAIVLVVAGIWYLLAGLILPSSNR